MSINKEFLRVIDANLNRSREGLRVCEDISRFILNSTALTRRIKRVRHGISAVARRTAYSRSLSRDSKADIGKRPLPSIEMGRRRIGDIFDANIERAKESIRVMEEFLKLTDRKASAIMSSLRFEVYDIESSAVRKMHALRGKPRGKSKTR